MLRRHHLARVGCGHSYLEWNSVRTAAHRQRADMMHGKARIPLSFWQSSDSSLAITSPTLNLKPKMMALIDTSLV
ncbi:hypothetical protein V6N13_001945 [Hibiscus sabdariffa]